MNTKSSSTRSIWSVSPFFSYTIWVATFLPSSSLMITFLTSIPYSTFTPWFSRYFTSGSIILSYWLYFVKRSALKSGSPSIWWQNLHRYLFISSADDHLWNANMVCQYSQKLVSQKESGRTSLIFLSSSSFSGVINSLVSAIWDILSSVNFLSVCASCPRFSEALQSE